MKMRNEIPKETRKLELIDRILDRTPYTLESALRQKLTKKLQRVLNEDDLYVIATATNIPKR